MSPLVTRSHRIRVHLPRTQNFPVAITIPAPLCSVAYRPPELGVAVPVVARPQVRRLTRPFGEETPQLAPVTAGTVVKLKTKSSLEVIVHRVAMRWVLGRGSFPRSLLQGVLLKGPCIVVDRGSWEPFPVFASDLRIFTKSVKDERERETGKGRGNFMVFQLDNKMLTITNDELILSSPSTLTAHTPCSIPFLIEARK